MTDTKGHAIEIARSLDAAFVIQQPVNLHVNGCANSCAQHYIGDIGLMGVKVGGEEGYQVNLGGGADNDHAIARQLFPAIKYTSLLPLLHALFAVYTRQCTEGESFVDFTRRHSIEALQGMALANVKREAMA